MLYSVTIYLKECGFRDSAGYGPHRQITTRVVEADDYAEALSLLNLGNDVERVEINPVTGDVIRTTPKEEDDSNIYWCCECSQQPVTKCAEMCEECRMRVIGF